MRFSQRIGKVGTAKALQIESIDIDLKNVLWNIVKTFVLDCIPRQKYSRDSEFDKFSQLLWHHFYKLPIDTIPHYDFEIEEYIRKRFFNDKWYEVYDFIEYLAHIESGDVNTNDFIKAINNNLEKEFSAYRFIDGKIAPISNDLEIKEIEQAINQVNYYTSLNGANIHLTNALDKIADKKNPDFRNSIKESISAVESTCRVLTDESTLGKALIALESKGIKIDDQLKNGFEKIYAYTNNKQSGIRHAIIDDHKNPDFEDAKYMLVSCSCFINFLIGKCKTLGIKIN
jgi:hypothetical protein